MNLEEAQVRVRQLNAQLFLKRQEERIKKLEEVEETFLKRHEAVLPDEFVSEIEARFVRPCGLTAEGGGRRRLVRRYVIWRAAQKMITALGMEPSDWFYHVHDIYDYFYQRQLSISYVQSILKLSNLWGHFISRKLCKPYWPIPMPKGYERQRMIEAYYKKEKWSRVPSKEITPEHLALLSGQINRPNFNWLYLSVWFGLRPQEIDCLHDKSMWRIEVLPTGRKVLWVFQTKIIALPPDDRWKPIPILFDEQHFALKIIESGGFKRPLIKTIRKHLGSGFSLYGGRKRFVDLMLARRHEMQNISIWMGHSTLSRTWRSYKKSEFFIFEATISYFG